MVKEGVVRVSSTDDPNNFDTVETNFDAGLQQAHAQIFLPNQPTKRYFQMTFNLTRDGATGSGTGPTYRMSEIDFRRPEEAPIYGATVVNGSLVDDGTVDPGLDGFVEANAIDDDYVSRFRIGQGSSPTTGFVIDLGGSQDVRSVGMYGNWTYVEQIQMLSDDVTVEAGNSASGPFTPIGSVNVGNTRPTDPDPTIGGENAWTGGNGRLIPCTPTNASHLRISGGYGFDNNIDLFEVVINPQSIIYRVDPVDGYTLTPQDLWDINPAPLNSRAGAEGFDRRLVTRVNPKGPLALTIDLGETPVIIEEIRIFPMDSDLSQLPKMGSVRTSSTDTPNNMDTLEVNLDTAIIYDGATIIPIPSNPEKRYVQVDLQADQGGSPTGMRFSEVEVIGQKGNAPGPTPTPIPSSDVNAWELYR